MSDNDFGVEGVSGQDNGQLRPGKGMRGVWKVGLIAVALFLVVPLIIVPLHLYVEGQIEVPSKHMAVLIHKTGKDLPDGETIAPDETYKGVQKRLLPEGRYFYNPYYWDWVIVRQVEIPEGKLGVRTRLYGDDLPLGEVIAWKESQRGLVPEVLRPGRYAINARVEGDLAREDDSFVETIELFEPAVVPAGFRGVVTKLSVPPPEDPSGSPMKEKDTLGLQQETLDPGTYYLNPYITRVNPVDCRSQRFNLSSKASGMMKFRSKDGFEIVLDGRIEFRVKPEEAAKVFANLGDAEDGGTIDEEIVSKVALPGARAVCGALGSRHDASKFVEGETRAKFQEDFQTGLRKKCDAEGIEIIQALIVSIRPPEEVVAPIRKREEAIRDRKAALREKSAP